MIKLKRPCAYRKILMTSLLASMMINVCTLDVQAGSYAIVGVSKEEETPEAEVVETEPVEETSETVGIYVIAGVTEKITTLDVTVPLGGINFHIDSEGQMTSQGIVITSNTNAPLNVSVLEVKALGIGDSTNGLEVTNSRAPKLVPVSTYTTEEWNNLSKEDTPDKMALAIRQVDVISGETMDNLTEKTTDDKKVTEPVELGDLSEESLLAHLESASDGSKICGINLEKSSKYTNFGKTWVGTENALFRYLVTLEFSLE